MGAPITPQKDFHAVSLSGGKDSTGLLLLMIERGMPIDAVLWADTGMEFPEMYGHIAKVDEHLFRKRGLHITVLRSPKSFEYMMFEEPKQKPSCLENRARLGIPPYGNGWPGIRVRWCTGQLKTHLINKEVNRLKGAHQLQQYVGIAADEAHRCKDLHYPLVDWGITEVQALQMINAMEVREDDEEFKNAVDLMFDELKERDPGHFAVRQYAKYKLAAGKTAKSILVSCGARLAPFDIGELRELTAYDELELDTLGDRKTALFFIMSDTDDTFNFLISMAYTQLFNLLCEKADDVYGGRLPIHVRCLIDEAANIGQIPRLEKLVATIRSREISACLVLQAQSQLKALYRDHADTIVGNMDARLFLGGSEPTTLKELSAALGKETIDTYNTGESRGRETSHTLNYQKLGKELASVDELAVLDGGKCILQLRGVRPFLSDKYDITKHPNYKYLSDSDKRNAFDIERFLSVRLKPKAEEVYDVYEVDLTDEEAATA